MAKTTSKNYGVRKRGKLKYGVNLYDGYGKRYYFWRRNPESLTEIYLKSLGLSIGLFGYKIEELEGYQEKEKITT